MLSPSKRVLDEFKTLLVKMAHDASRNEVAKFNCNVTLQCVGRSWIDLFATLACCYSFIN
jgi:hypothetical protein